jgi:hypothetical protein
MTTGDKENGTVTCSCPKLEGDVLRTLLPVMTGPSDAMKDAFTGVPISTLTEAPPEPLEGVLRVAVKSLSRLPPP